MTILSVSCHMPRQEQQQQQLDEEWRKVLKVAIKIKRSEFGVEMPKCHICARIRDCRIECVAYFQSRVDEINSWWTKLSPLTWSSSGIPCKRFWEHESGQHCQLFGHLLNVLDKWPGTCLWTSVNPEFSTD